MGQSSPNRVVPLAVLYEIKELREVWMPSTWGPFSLSPGDRNASTVGPKVSHARMCVDLVIGVPVLDINSVL